MPAASNVRPIPEGYHTVTPYLRCREAAKAIEFYKAAFGAEEVFRMPGPGGTIMHAEVRIGDSFVMVSDEFPNWGAKGPQSYGGTTVGLHLYVADADAAFARATAAGATVMMPLTNQFWGDRYGKLQDPFGHEWSVSQHVEDVPPDEMERRAAEMMKQMG
ncbi:MAG TPA: VOC family protein [Tepidisphaeraceae bacterium]|nr:VOC family protein [Tepidisphaeraceae bacterium]